MEIFLFALRTIHLRFVYQTGFFTSVLGIIQRIMLLYRMKEYEQSFIITIENHAHECLYATCYSSRM